MLQLFPPQAWPESSIETEFDPYYSNVGYYLGFGEKAIPEVVIKDNTTVLRRMLESTFTIPQSFLIEASISHYRYLVSIVAKITPTYMMRLTSAVT